MKKRCVYTIELTREQAEFLALLDSYVARSPLSDISEQIADELGEPEINKLTFEVYEGGYDHVVGTFREVIIRE